MPNSQRRKRQIALLALVLAVAGIFAAGGCARRIITSEYTGVLNKWTRHKKVHVGLDARLYMYATYKAPQFRTAYINQYAKSYQLDDEYRQMLLAREKEASESFNEFFFTAYTPDESWNDFDLKNSVWQLYLEDDQGNRLTPLSITRVDSSEPLVRQFFPYYDFWSAAYLIKFPKYTIAGQEPIPNEKTKKLRLVVTGVIGKGELAWDLGD